MLRFPRQKQTKPSASECVRIAWRNHQRGVLLISIAAAVAGTTGFAGAVKVLDYTNTTEFCITCHEMEVMVYEEYRKTVHYNNRTGVRVGCSECHVPKTGVAKLIRKIGAAKDVYGHIIGTIDTVEKFESARLEMAETVWRYMESSDSRECRSCHAFEAMDFEKQARRPRRKHPAAMKKGDTCIDCHKGVAHKLPEGFELND